MESNREDPFSFASTILCFGVSGLGVFYKKETDKLETTGQKIIKMVRGLMHRIYKERLREMGVFGPKERCLRRDFTAVFNHLMGD